MPGIIWSTLRSNIQGRLRDENARTWTAAQLLRIANGAQRHVVMRAWDMDPALFLKANDIRSEANRDSYDLPRDFGRLQWFERGDLGANYKPHIRVIEATEANSYRYGTIFARWYDDHPQDARQTAESIYLIGNSKFVVVPTPTVATRIYRCYYLALPADLIGTSDVSALPVKFQTIFELETCIRAMREAKEDYTYFADEATREWALLARAGDRNADADIVLPPTRVI